jgi:uncharacterized protein DUF6455
MDAAIPIALALAAFVVAPFVYAAVRVRRMAREGSRVRLFEVVQGQNLSQPDAQSDASVRSGAHAVRRCVNCLAQASCDRAIAEHDWNAFDELCPNADYLRGLGQASR